MDSNLKETKQFLFYGLNSIFIKRLFEIIKRDHKCSGINYQFKSKFDKNIYFNFIDSEKLISQSVYEGLDTIVISSEVLHNITSEEDFNDFKHLINEISTNNKVRLLYISIANPISVNYNKKDDSLFLKEPLNNNYNSWTYDILNSIDTSKNFIYELDSFISYNLSDFEENPLHLIKKYPVKQIDKSLKTSFSFNSADDFINELIINIDNIGILKSKVPRITLEFNEFRNKLNSLLLSSYSQDSYTKLFNHSNEEDLIQNDQSISKNLNQSECSIQLLYRKKPAEIINNKPLASWRYDLGRDLYNSIPSDVINEIDCIVPVPETGKYYAQGLADAAKKPYLEAFYKKQDIGRSYDIQNSDKRKDFINSKLGIHKGFLKGKSIGLVDEAIFTGATLKIACNLLKTENLKKVFIIIPSPSCKRQCSFNMQPIRTLLLEYVREKDLHIYFDVNGVYFQKTSTYDEVMRSANFSCTKCFK